MNGVPTKKQLDEAYRLAKEFDWSRFDAMSDEEIRAHWAWDKDMAWPTAEELAAFDLVIPAKARREMARAKALAEEADKASNGPGLGKPPKEAAE